MGSVVSDITNNIQSTLHGASLTYNSEAHTITCEKERFVNELNNRYPYCLILGPVVDVTSRAHRVSNCMLNYLLNVRVDDVDDEYDPDASVDEITTIVEDIVPNIIVLLSADLTRGGKAEVTNWSRYGYYFDEYREKSVFTVFLELEIRALINSFNPFLVGG